MKVLITLTVLVVPALVIIALSDASATGPGEYASQGSGDSALTATPEAPPTWPPTPEDRASMIMPIEGAPAIQPSSDSGPVGEPAITEAGKIVTATLIGPTIHHRPIGRPCPHSH